MCENYRAETYRQNKAVSELTDAELIKLGQIFADRLITWATNENYEPWEFDSEEMPSLIRDGLDIGLIRERKSHIKMVETVVYDE